MSDVKAVLTSNGLRTIIAVVAIMVTISIYLLNRKKKSLSYQVVRNDELIKVDKLVQSRVLVTVDGQPAVGLSLIILEIQNTGNEPIKTVDFERPLTFQFTSANVISARALDTWPKDLAVQCQSKG